LKKATGLFVFMFFVFSMVSCAAADEQKGSGAEKKIKTPAAEPEKQADKKEKKLKSAEKQEKKQKKKDKKAYVAEKKEAKAENKKTNKRKWKYPESAAYYPAHVGDTLYFRGYFKDDEEKKTHRVKAVVSKTEQKDGIDYYYYDAGKIGIRYLIRKRDSGVYMRVMKYPFPIFGFLIEVNIKPEMCVMKFPLKSGEKWVEKGRAETRILGMWDVGRDIRSDFEVVGRETIDTEIGKIDTVHIRVLVDDGDGDEPTLEKYWYGKNIGYARSDTSSHFVEIVGYEVFNDEKGEVVKVLPKDGVENYE